MSHLDYYKYQAKARGVCGPEDITRYAQERAYLYDRLLAERLPQDKSARIADLACGHGSFLVWLQQQGFTDIIGVDSSKEQVALARSLGFRIVEAEVIEWLEKQPCSGFDVLCAIDFIEHISKDDFVRFLGNCHSALVKRGVLILRYPNGDSPFVGLNLFNDITHVWTYTTNCLQSLAAMHGFDHVAFLDESLAIRDHRWIKVALSKMSRLVVRVLFQAVSRERVNYWHSCIWAILIK